jgi:hypothetical protein
MFARSALLLGVKVVAIAHNAAHASLLQKLLIEFIVQGIKDNNHILTPVDKETRLKEAQSPRLVAWLAQKGKQSRPRAAQDPQDPRDAKRAKLAVSLDNMLTAMLSKTPNKPKPEMETPMPEKEPKAGAASATGATGSTPEEPQTPTGGSAPSSGTSPAPEKAHDLAALLKQWGS